MKLLIALLPLLAIACADELADCKCIDGYNPIKDDSGEVNCHGIVLKSILPCNILTRPKCVCSKEATSVVSDHKGTFCGKFVDGKEDRRWECENKEDWTTFFEQHPEEKP